MFRLTGENTNKLTFSVAKNLSENTLFAKLKIESKIGYLDIVLNNNDLIDFFNYLKYYVGTEPQE